MEELILLCSIIYVVYSLLASAIYYNAITPHSRSQKALHHLLIWIVPFIWALYLKRTTPEFNSRSDARSSSGGYAEISEWGVDETKREAYFAERGFESVYAAFEVGMEA